jgi:hypothetical protein
MYTTYLYTSSFIGKRKSNCWFSYSTPYQDVNKIEAPTLPSQAELDFLEYIPRHYNKDTHDTFNHTVVCECVSFIIALRSDGRDPLRLAYVHHYETERMETPKWIDAWHSPDTADSFQALLIELDSIHSTIKKLSGYRPKIQVSDTEYAIRWATIHAQLRMFEADVEGSKGPVPMIPQSEDVVIE